MTKIFTKWQWAPLRTLFGLAALLLAPMLGQAQAFTATYPFTSVTATSGNVDPTDPITTVPGVTFGSFFGSVPGNSSAASRFSLAGWPLNSTVAAGTNNATTFDANPDAAKYYSVTLTPKKGTNVKFSLTSITFLLQRSGTGIRQYVVRSSADGYAANLPASIAPANANLSVVATNVFQVTDASTSSNAGSTVTLSGASFTDVSGPLTFRFYGYNAEQSGGTFSLDDVKFTGSYSGTPDPANGSLTISKPIFANTPATSSSTQPVTLTNSSASAQTANLSLYPVYAATPFSIVDAGGAALSSIAVPANGTATVYVKFAPATAGVTSYNRIVAAVAGFQDVVGPLFSGLSTAPPTFPSIAVAQGATAYPDGGTTAYDFGYQPQGGSTADVTFTITNSSSTDDLTISSITSGSTQYIVSGVPATVAKNGGTGTFKVHFTPSAAGTQTSTLTINNNSAASTDVYTIRLTGVSNGAPTITETSTTTLLTGITSSVLVQGTGFNTTPGATTVSYSGGTVSNLVVSSGQTLRVDLTPTANGPGNLTVTTAAATGGGTSAATVLTASTPATDGLFEPFELYVNNGTANTTTYPTTAVTLTENSGSITLLQTLLSNTSLPIIDNRNNSQSARIRGGGYIEFVRPNGVGTVSFLAAKYPGDNTSFTLSYSVNGGSFVVVAGTPAAGSLPATLTPYSYALNKTGSVVVRISNTNTTAGSTNRINIDDVRIGNGDLTVASGENISASGSYNNVTIQSGGVLTLNGNLTINGALVIENGGRLNTKGATNCFTVSGPGTFILQDGGTLSICDPAGISLTSTTAGAVRVAGTRTFSGDASYIYNNGGGSQSTGDGLPATVRNLTASTGDGLTLTQAVAVKQVARITTATLISNGLLTLSSSPNADKGTALLIDEVSTDNNGGAVQGAVNVQRAITRSGEGYRHMSSPITNATVASLATPEFVQGVNLIVNDVYNTAVRPRRVVPFPTVFGYDETRLVTSVGTEFAFEFDKGFFSPKTYGDPLLVGRGYDVQLPTTTVTFTGPVNNGTYTLPLTNNGTTTPSQSGFNLVGNMYPSPLNLTNVQVADAADNSFYMFESTGKYEGTYRSYNQTGNVGNPVVALGQGIFMHVTAAGGPAVGSVTMTNADRVTVFNAADGIFNRGVASTRPLLTLTLTNAAGTRADQTSVYFADQATAGVEGKFDTRKLANMGTSLNLSSLADGQYLAVNALPTLEAGQVVLVPLGGYLPQTGSFRLSAEQLVNFSAGTTVALRDGLTGTRTVLTPGASYAFTTTANDLKGRFTLEFSTAGALATTAGQALAAQISLYPNPAHGSFTLSLPVLKEKLSTTAHFSNSLGQTVRQLTLPATVAGQPLTTQVDVRSLPAGIYQLHLTIGQQQVVRRVVVE